MRRVSHAIAAASLMVAANVAGAIEVGTLAPDFTLQDVNGVTRTLSDLHGKAVLLAFVGHG